MGRKLYPEAAGRLAPQGGKLGRRPGLADLLEEGASARKTGEDQSSNGKEAVLAHGVFH